MLPSTQCRLCTKAAEIIMSTNYYPKDRKIDGCNREGDHCLSTPTNACPLSCTKMVCAIPAPAAMKCPLRGRVFRVGSFASTPVNQGRPSNTSTFSLCAFNIELLNTVRVLQFLQGDLPWSTHGLCIVFNLVTSSACSVNPS